MEVITFILLNYHQVDVLVVSLDLEWEQSFGGDLNEGAFSVVSLSDGYAIAGYTFSFVDSIKNSDMFFLKVDLSGNRVF